MIHECELYKYMDQYLSLECWNILVNNASMCSVDPTLLEEIALLPV